MYGKRLKMVLSPPGEVLETQKLEATNYRSLNWWVVCQDFSEIKQYQTQTHPWKLTCSFENLHVQFRKYIYIYIYIFIHVWIFQSTVGGWGKDPKSRSWSNLGVSSVVSFSHPSISLGDLCYRMAREFVAGWISLDACEFKKGAFLGGFIYYGI